MPSPASNGSGPSSTLALVPLLLLLLLLLPLPTAPAGSLSAHEAPRDFSPARGAGAADYREWREFKEFQEFQAWEKRAGAAAERAERDGAGGVDGRGLGWTSDREEGARKHRRQQHQPGVGKHRRQHGSTRHEDDGSATRHRSADEDAADAAAAAAAARWSRKGSREYRDPPPIDQAALMARYIVNQAAWTSVATISSRKDIKGYPFTNVNSVSDGPLGNGTGIPYLYLTPLDFTAQDIYKDNRATLMMTLAQGHYCKVKDYDPMDPRCARVVLSGKIKEVKENSPEYPTAKSAVFGRHPWLAHMPADHHFFFAKLKIASIAVLDTFGGPKYVAVKDYLNPPNPISAFAESFDRYQTAEGNAEFSVPMVTIHV